MMKLGYGAQNEKIGGYCSSWSGDTVTYGPKGCACSKCSTVVLDDVTPAEKKLSICIRSFLVFVGIGAIATFTYFSIGLCKAAPDGALVAARGLKEADITGRYAYQSLRDLENRKTPKPEQVVPLVELVEDGKTITARVSHTHPNPAPARAPRDNDIITSPVPSSSHSHHPPGPVIHNASDLEDILFDVGRTKEPRAETGDQVHTEFETRTVAYSTRDDGLVYYRASEFQKVHTHAAGAPMPIAPDINPDMVDGDRQKGVEYENHGTVRLTTTFSHHDKIAADQASPTAIPAQVNSEVQSEQTGLSLEQATGTRVAKVAPMVVNTHGFKGAHTTDHDDTNGDIPSYNRSLTITRAARSLELTTSLIADAFFDLTRTVTHVGGSTWRQVTTPPPEPRPLPTNKILGPPVTVFEPVINITYEIIPMQNDDPKITDHSYFWRPVATGSPTRADHISVMSSWRANGGTYPAMPTKYEIVWDHRTNTTWNMTVEGTWDNWIEVYVSITTQYPAPSKSPVPLIPEWPGEEGYSQNTYLTVPPGPNWVGPSTTSTGPPTLSDGRAVIFPTPTEEPNSVQEALEPAKRSIDPHYPTPFFPKGADNYDVWSEWIGFCGVIKHVTEKNETHLPLKPFGDLHKLGGDYVESMCFKGMNYYIHIDNESKAGKYWLASLIMGRDILADGYADKIPGWVGFPKPTITKNIHDILQAEWIGDCLVLFHHAGPLSWGDDLMHKARSHFDANGRRYLTPQKDTVQPPRKCEKIDMLLHIEEYHSLDGFQIGDWWITPYDKEPFYIGDKVDHSHPSQSENAPTTTN